MDLTFGLINLPALIMAFGSGVFGAAVGGTQGFAILGLTGIGSIALDASGVSFLNSTIFGYWLHPAIWFAACEVATSFAGKMKYWHNPKDVSKALAALRQPIVLFVGGIAGIVSYLVFYFFSFVVGLNADNGATTILLVPILYKLITEKTLFGHPDKHVLSNGGRFSVRHDVHWIPHMHDGPSKLIWGFGIAAVAAAACYEIGLHYGAMEDLSIWKSNSPCLFGFYVAALSLVFAISAEATAYHHITLSAGYAFCQAAATGCDIGTAFIWALGIGTAACFLADAGADLICVHGDTWIDPPAMANFASSLLVFNLPASVLSNVTVPIGLLIVCTVLAFTYYKRVPAVAEETA